MVLVAALCVGLGMCVTPSGMHAASGGKTYRVLILPLTINAEKDLSFLQTGIFDMLATRLSAEGEVVTVGRDEALQALAAAPQPVNEQGALALAGQLEADYVVFGSLTLFGERISTDARFLDVREQKPLVVFNQYGETPGDVITHINYFAAEINQKVFGRQTQGYKLPEPRQAPAELRQHPEKMFAEERGRISGTATMVGSEGGATFDIWKSRKFEGQIGGMAVGDVDGDGRNEIVYAFRTKISVFRRSEGRFERIGEFEGTRNDDFIGVDVADINHNGKAEIFVTNLNRGLKILQSFVVEWDSGKFTTVSEASNWYYRVIQVAGRGDVLMGQQRGIDEIFLAGVFAMRWTAGQYAPADPQPLPRGVNVFAFTYGDATNSGTEMILTLGKFNRLRMFDMGGQEEWTSAEAYGSSATYLDWRDESSARIGEYIEMNRLFLPQRILIRDIDQDGKNDVIVSQNKDIAGELFMKFRQFNSGHIECLAWDKLGLSRKWRTPTIYGYISDYAIADTDNDGKDEIVVSVSEKGNLAFGKGRSYLVSLQLK